MVRERVERGNAALPQTQSTLSIAEIRQIISLMNSSDIEEIAIEQEADGLKLTLRKPAPAATASTISGEVEFGEPVEPLAAGETARDNTVSVTAPLVGVFRASMKPGGKALVSVGDVVREGQVIAAIEALNVLNEVEAGASGRVSEILATEGQPVEYGQPLLVIELQPA